MTGLARSQAPGDNAVEIRGLDKHYADGRVLRQVFHGYDVDIARGQWKALTGAGAKAKYWSQAAGRWEMKAES